MASRRRNRQRRWRARILLIVCILIAALLITGVVLLITRPWQSDEQQGSEQAEATATIEPTASQGILAILDDLEDEEMLTLAPQVSETPTPELTATPEAATEEPSTEAPSTEEPSPTPEAPAEPTPSPTPIPTPTRAPVAQATATKAPTVIGSLPEGGSGVIDLDAAPSIMEAIKPYLIRGVEVIELYSNDPANFDKVQKAFNTFFETDEFGDYLAGYSAEMLQDHVFQNRKTNYMCFKVQYMIPAAEVASAVEKVNQMAGAFAASTGGTDRERVIAAAKYVASLATYGGSGGYENTSFGNMVRGQCKCEGYTHAMMVILKRMGIECARMRGVVEAGDHAWVKVYVDGAWYHADPTYVSVTGDNGFALMTEADIRKTHSW